MTETTEHAGANPLQRTGSWLQERTGCLTASQAAPLWAVLKSGKPSKARQDLLVKLVTERLTGNAEQSFVSAAMQWGIDHEAEAIAAYEAATGELVELTGFVRHPAVPWLGASPDGLVGTDGLIEVKCPSSTTHSERLMSAGVPDMYRPQLLVQLVCTGRKWVDYVDFDPRFPPKYRLIVRRFEPSAAELADALERCKSFLREVDETLARLGGKPDGQSAQPPAKQPQSSSSSVYEEVPF